MIQRIGNLIDRLPRPVALLVGLAAVPALGLVDYQTGYEVSFAFFYLAPVGFVAWFVGRGAGVALSLASAVIWQVSNIPAGESVSNPMIFYWNASTRLGFFLVVAFLLDKLRRTLADERELSRTDPLTGALNRRAFYEAASAGMLRARRHGRPLTVAYVDLDGFKAVNDLFGHAVGDRALAAVAAAMRASVRQTDAVARLGGDEFAVLLPETDAEGAREWMMRVRDRLRKTMKRRGWPVTFSIGVPSYATPPATAEELLREADRSMYNILTSKGREVRRPFKSYKEVWLRGPRVGLVGPTSTWR